MLHAILICFVEPPNFTRLFATALTGINNTIISIKLISSFRLGT